MSQDRHSEAIVLRRSDSSESDRRLTLLTREFGKIDVIAKGARKAKSRLAGSSEPLTMARFAWAEGKVRRFVTQVEPVTSYPTIRKDYVRLLLGLAIVEVVAASVEYEGEVEPIFELVQSALQTLNSETKPEPVFVWALARLLVEEGLGPDWMRCNLTGEPVTLTPAAVSAHAGGHIADDVASQFNDVHWVSAETLVALAKVSELDAPPTKLRGAAECAFVLVRFWQGILDRKLASCESAIRELQSLPE